MRPWPSGAAIQGSMLADTQNAPNMLLLDLTPHALGIAITGGYFKEIIAKDSPIPISKSHIFTTERDFQEQVPHHWCSRGKAPTKKATPCSVSFPCRACKKPRAAKTRIKVFFDSTAMAP